MGRLKTQSLNCRFVVSAVGEGLAGVDVHDGVSFDYFHIVISLLSQLTILGVSIVGELPQVQMVGISNSVYLRLIDCVLSIEVVKVCDLECEDSGGFMLSREADVSSVFVCGGKYN